MDLEAKTKLPVGGDGLEEGGESELVGMDGASEHIGVEEGGAGGGGGQGTEEGVEDVRVWTGKMAE